MMGIWTMFRVIFTLVMFPSRLWHVCRGIGLMTPTRQETPGANVVLRREHLKIGLKYGRNQ